MKPEEYIALAQRYPRVTLNGIDSGRELDRAELLDPRCAEKFSSADDYIRFALPHWTKPVRAEELAYRVKVWAESKKEIHIGIIILAALHNGCAVTITGVDYNGPSGEPLITPPKQKKAANPVEGEKQ